MLYNVGINENLVKEGFAQFDEADQPIMEVIEETKTEEEEWEEEALLLDRLHADILKMDEKEGTKLDIEILSRRSENLRIKYAEK